MTEQILTNLKDLLEEVKFENNKQLGESLSRLLEDMAERLAEAPASTRKDFHHCRMGGLLEHMLGTISYAKHIASGVPDLIDPEELVAACIISNLGKLGSPEHAFYVPVKEQWQIKRGIEYQVNEKLLGFSQDNLTILLTSKYNIPLTADILLAVQFSYGEDSTGMQGLFNKTAGHLPVIVNFAKVLSARTDSKQLDKPEKVKAENSGQVKAKAVFAEKKVDPGSFFVTKD